MDRPGFTDALRAVVRRELRALRHDGWLLALVTWWPLLMVVVVAATFPAGLPRDLPLRVVDHDRSATSPQLARFIGQAPTLRVDGSPADDADAFAAVRRGDAVGLLVVPEGFERRLRTGGPNALQLFVNGQLSTAASVMQSDVQVAVTLFSAGAELQIRTAHGEPAAAALGAVEPLRPGLVTLFNGAMNYEGFLVPALGAALVQMFAMFTTVVLIGRELREATVPAWLAAAGGRPGAALAGKLVVGMVPLLAIGWGLVGWLVLAREFTVAGSLPLLLAAWGLMVAANAALGVLVIGLASGLRLGLSAAGFITSPAFTYGGVAFPVAAMPLLAQGWSAALPLTHFLRLQSEQWWMGAPWPVSMGSAAALTAFALLPWFAAPAIVRRMARPAAWRHP